MAIDLQPATNPLDIPSPKPSAIVRNWPDAMWRERFAKTRNRTTGRITFCAIGIANEVNGYQWGEPDSLLRDGDNTLMDVWFGGSHSDAIQFFMDRYGLTQDEADELARINDCLGKYVAANYLESLGK